MSLVGIDIGSSAVKAGAYDDTGAPIALVREPVSDHYPAHRVMRRCTVDGTRPFFDPNSP